ncbi:pentapeptide repeat-containing protein [Micromonospora zamorensis]|uniref:pentapeptide repeat-containing protein n=1 Tax=Micromonospora zamorensis TaxID=709883 RepID=UPI003CF60FC8
MALMLALRKQYVSERTEDLNRSAVDRSHAHQEAVTDFDQRHKEAVAQEARLDAVERRFTDLYVKAAEQLGSEKAPVRLAGMYALERLASDNVAQRQMIVNVLCSYLRMPFSGPFEARTYQLDRRPELRSKAGIKHKPSPMNSTSAEVPGSREELEVRLVAQDIIWKHLQPFKTPDEHHKRGTEPNPHFWEDLDIDLAGAQLVGFGLNRCRLNYADFTGAVFHELASFEHAEFRDDAFFDGSLFLDRADFSRAKFERRAWFHSAAFRGTFHFFWVEAHNVNFALSDFQDGAWFSSAKLGLDPGFNFASFGGEVDFKTANIQGSFHMQDVKVYNLGSQYRRMFWPSPYRLVVHDDDPTLGHLEWSAERTLN